MTSDRNIADDPRHVNPESEDSGQDQENPDDILCRPFGEIIGALASLIQAGDGIDPSRWYLWSVFSQRISLSVRMQRAVLKLMKNDSRVVPVNRGSWLFQGAVGLEHVQTARSELTGDE